MGKILKKSTTENIQPISLDTFLSVDKGTTAFEVETFSTVEKGTKTFTMQRFETVTDEKDADAIEVESNSTVDEPVEEIVDDTPEDMMRLEQHEIELKAAVQEATKIATDEAYQKGFQEAKEQFEKSYLAEKQDYIKQLETNMKAAVSELSQMREMVAEIDKDIPEIVLGFVKELIGTERKLNDELIVSMIQNGLSKISDMEDISFIVNPEDEHTVKTHVSGYALEADPQVDVGGFAVKTRIGEIDFSIETLLGQLEKSIHEKLTTSEEC